MRVINITISDYTVSKLEKKGKQFGTKIISKKEFMDLIK